MSQLIGCFWYTLLARWQVVGQLQVHCLSRLNTFIPCVCTFTYLSLLIVLMADTSSFSCPCCSFEYGCKSRTWARQYTRIHGAFQGIHRSREPGCDKWYILRYNYSARMQGPLSWSMWGSLRLAPINAENNLHNNTCKTGFLAAPTWTLAELNGSEFNNCSLAYN